MEEVGAQRRLDRVQVLANDAVLTEIGHLLQRVEDTLLDFALTPLTPFVIPIEVGGEACQEQLHDAGRDMQVVGHCLGHVIRAERKM